MLHNTLNLIYLASNGIVYLNWAKVIGGFEGTRYFGGIDSGLVYNGQTNDIALLMRVIRDRSLSPLVLSPDVLVPVERTWSIDKEVLPAL